MGMDTSERLALVKLVSKGTVSAEEGEVDIPMKMTSKPPGLSRNASRARRPFDAFSNSHLFFFMYVARSIMLTGLSYIMR